MFFTLLGLGIFCYGLFYTIILCFIDCDLELAFYEKFGKSLRKMQGKVVFITGASSGIGEGMAKVFAKHGVKLVLTARRLPELERVKSQCLACSGGKLLPNDILVLQMDVLDLDLQQSHWDYAVQYFGGIDVLVNNAGRSQRANFEDISLTVDKQMFDLNVFAVLNLSRIAVKYFNGKGTGHIAVTSSVAGIMGVPFSATYTGSKHALHGYFNGLRTEQIKKGLTVTMLCPGPVYTNFLSECFTGAVGEKYGVSAKATDKRLTAERCGELCALAIVNKTRESWMGLFPIIPFVYIGVYFPLVFNLGVRVLGSERLFKLRDSDNAAAFTEKNRTE